MTYLTSSLACTFPPPHPYELITFICRTGALLFIFLNVDDLRLVGPGSRGKGDLQEAEREKRKRQRIEPVVVVKEVVLIGDDSAEPDHWQSTNTRATILGSTHLSRALEGRSVRGDARLDRIPEDF